MGNQLKLTQVFNDFKNHNAYHTYEQLKQKISLINEAFKQNQKKLGLKIELSKSSIRFESFNWKKSTVKGFIEIVSKSKSHSLKQKEQQDEGVKENIILSYQDIIALYNSLKNLEQTKYTPGKSRIQQQQTPVQTPNPNQIKQNEENQCCICFQKAPSMVLPCSHAFCDNCTIKYIIETQQKKCPQCRQQIKGSNRQSIEKQIYTIIQEDSQVFEQIKFDILQVLKNMNSRIVNNIQQNIQKS